MRLGVTGRSRTGTCGVTFRSSAIELRPHPSARGRKLDSTVRVVLTRACAVRVATRCLRPLGYVEIEMASRARLEKGSGDGFRCRPIVAAGFGSRGWSARELCWWRRVRDSNPRCRDVLKQRRSQSPASWACWTNTTCFGISTSAVSTRESSRRMRCLAAREPGSARAHPGTAHTLRLCGDGVHGHTRSGEARRDIQPAPERALQPVFKERWALWQAQARQGRASARPGAVSQKWIDGKSERARILAESGPLKIRAWRVRA